MQDDFLSSESITTVDVDLPDSDFNLLDFRPNPAHSSDITIRLRQTLRVERWLTSDVRVVAKRNS